MGYGTGEEDGARRANCPRDRRPRDRRKPVIRKAFVMSVDSDSHAEYARRHGPIWPELEAVLKSHGVHNYSIFLQPEAHQLFGYVEVESEARWEAIAGTDVCRRWWTYMKDIMPANPDDSPISRDLAEVFHLD